MTAGELMNHPAGDDDMWGPLSDNTDLYEEKVSESRFGPSEGTHGNIAGKNEDTLEQSIKNKGVQTPIELDFVSPDDDTPIISDGHHRIAIANHINPNMYIPINYSDHGDSWFNLGIDPRKQKQS
jgi:hypothetical protein